MVDVGAISEPVFNKFNGVIMRLLTALWKDESGQDLIEYTLLLAFVALASAALFIGAGNSVQGIWSVTNCDALRLFCSLFSATSL